MARKRKPDNVHILAGTYNTTKHGDKKRKVVIKSDGMKAPGWLDKLGRAEWARIIELFKTQNIYTNADVAILAAYCNMYSVLQQDPESYSAAQYTQLRMCAIELGLTPSSRSKLVTPKADEDDFDSI